MHDNEMTFPTLTTHNPLESCWFPHCLFQSRCQRLLKTKFNEWWIHRNQNHAGNHRRSIYKTTIARVYFKINYVQEGDSKKIVMRENWPCQDWNDGVTEFGSTDWIDFDLAGDVWATRTSNRAEALHSQVPSV